LYPLLPFTFNGDDVPTSACDSDSHLPPASINVLRSLSLTLARVHNAFPVPGSVRHRIVILIALYDAL